jgi:uncharacterized protein YjbJ (UPF0337 family)
MAGKLEKSKGKVKEVVGTLTGNRDLETDGRIDRRAGEAKEKAAGAKNKVEAAAKKVERKAIKAIDRAKDAARRK